MDSADAQQAIEERMMRRELREQFIKAVAARDEEAIARIRREFNGSIVVDEDEKPPLPDRRSKEAIREYYEQHKQFPKEA